MSQHRDVNDRRARSTRIGERGQSIVELALIMPLLLMLVALAADFGRVYYSYVGVIGAAEQGARVGSNSAHTNDAIERAVMDEPGLLVTIDQGDITISPPSGRAPGSAVEVTVTHAFAMVTPLPSVLFGTSEITLTARASHVVW